MEVAKRDEKVVYLISAEIRLILIIFGDVEEGRWETRLWKRVDVLIRDTVNAGRGDSKGLGVWYFRVIKLYNFILSEFPCIDRHVSLLGYNFRGGKQIIVMQMFELSEFCSLRHSPHSS